MAGDMDHFHMKAPQIEHRTVLQGDKAALIRDGWQEIRLLQRRSRRQLGSRVAHAAFQGLLPEGGDVRRMDIDAVKICRAAAVIWVHVGQHHVQRLIRQPGNGLLQSRKARAGVHQQCLPLPLHQKQEHAAGILQLGNVGG